MQTVSFSKSEGRVEIFTKFPRSVITVDRYGVKKEGVKGFELSWYKIENVTVAHSGAKRVLALQTRDQNNWPKVINIPYSPEVVEVIHENRPEFDLKTRSTAPPLAPVFHPSRRRMSAGGAIAASVFSAVIGLFLFIGMGASIDVWRDATMTNTTEFTATITSISIPPTNDERVEIRLAEHPSRIFVHSALLSKLDSMDTLEVGDEIVFRILNIELADHTPQRGFHIAYLRRDAETILSLAQYNVVARSQRLFLGLLLGLLGGGATVAAIVSGIYASRLRRQNAMLLMEQMRQSQHDQDPWTNV